MVSRGPISEQQVQILRWVSEGCPIRHWPNSSYKNTATALQSRRLVTVTRRRGTWAAHITDAGKHYLATGAYPAGHWPRALSDLHPLSPAPLSTPVARPVPRVPPAPPAVPHERPLVKAVLNRLLAADGPLDYDERDEGLTSQQLIESSRRAENLPFGKKLSCERIGGWQSPTYSLRLVDDFAALIEERPVPVPERLIRRHPTTSAYMNDTDRHEVSRDSLKRAERIVKALAREALRRGYKLTPVHSRRLTDGQVQAEIDGFTYPLRLREKAASGAPPTDYMDRSRNKLPAWQANRPRQFLPTGQLEVALSYPRDGRTARFGDGASRTLEDRLPALLREVEMRAGEDAWQREREAEKAVLRRQAWEAAMEMARTAHREAQLVQELDRQLGRYSQVRLLRECAAALRAEIDVPEDRLADAKKMG